MFLDPLIQDALKRYNFDSYPNSLTQFVVREMFSDLGVWRPIEFV